MSMRKTIGALAALALAATVVPAAQADVAPPALRAPPAPRQAEALPYKNGPVSAVAIFIPDSQVSEFEKPPNETPRVTKIDALKVGEIAALKLMFKGPQRDSQGRIDVTFDVDFIGPDGKTLEGGSLKDLPAYQGPATLPDAIFDNIRAVPKMSFEAKDPKGVYKAVIVLHDNIGGWNIPMTVELERL